MYNKLEYNQKILKAYDQLGSTQGPPGVVTKVDLSSAHSLFCLLIPFTSLVSDLIIL